MFNVVAKWLLAFISLTKYLSLVSAGLVVVVVSQLLKVDVRVTKHGFEPVVIYLTLG